MCGDIAGQDIGWVAEIDAAAYGREGARGHVGEGAGGCRRPDLGRGSYAWLGRGFCAGVVRGTDRLIQGVQQAQPSGELDHPRRLGSRAGIVIDDAELADRRVATVQHDADLHRFSVGRSTAQDIGELADVLGGGRHAVWTT